MSRTLTHSRGLRLRWAALAGTVAIAACAHTPRVGDSAAVRGSLRFLEREAPAPATGPVVVMLEPADRAVIAARPPQLFEVASSTDRFDPGFSVVAAGDYLTFVNDGPVSHRFFSADLGPDVQIPVGPRASSEALQVDESAEVRFFCSLHPDETFGVLVTSGVFFAVVDAAGRYYVGPVPGGSYRLSIWSPQVKGSIRTIEVQTGRTAVETIWLDPELIGR